MTTNSPEPQPAKARSGFSRFRRFFARDGREHLWAFLDALDDRPALKKTLLIGIPALVIIGGLGAWGYERWTKTNSLRIARQWIDAGRLDQAGLAVRDALAAEPEMPASWRLASELAWKMGNRPASVEYAKKAAAVGRYQGDDVLAWAEASVLADDVDQAEEAEGFLDADAKVTARAQRLAGEVARRSKLFDLARDRFQAALRADTQKGLQSPAIDEVPLGIACLQTGSDSDRIRGQALLTKWAPNPNWGAEALRALLADAIVHTDSDAAARWAEALRVHPRCTLGDVPVCLKAFADFSPERYKIVVRQLEDKSVSISAESAELMGWLAQIGQASEAVRWGGSLDPEAARKPPIVLAMAEALRATRRWNDLQAWDERGEWGDELEFMGWAYGMLAARQLGDDAKAASLWQTLYDNARASPAHALILGDTLYSWGYPKDAALLLWAASERPDLAFQALGSLARLYQVQRDAVGEYRAFSRLNSIRPTDRKIANNYAYFAAVTGLGSQTQVEQIAADNFQHDPTNVDYRATYGFVLVWAGQGAQAMTLLEPVAKDWRKSHSVAFAYGAALASIGRKAEAKEVFDSLDFHELGPQETDLIRSALR